MADRVRILLPIDKMKGTGPIMNVLVISIALRVMICCLVFAFFVFLPLKSRYRYSNLKTGALILLLSLITTAITVFFFISGVWFYKFSTLGILLWLVSAVLIFHLTIRGSHFEIFFIVLVVLNLYVNIIAIAKIISEVLQVMNPAIQSAIAAGVLIAYIPLLWFLMFKLYKQVIEFNISFSFWKYIWIIPALTYFVFFIKFVKDYWIKNAPIGTGDIVFSILWSFTTYVLFVVTLLMLIQAYKGITAEEKNQMIASQLRMQEIQYQRMLEQIEETARLRHDLRHHLISIGGFAENGDLPGLKGYLAELIPETSLNDKISVCQNHVSDVILQYYTGMAKKCGTKVSLTTDIPEFVSVSDIDLCMIFGNLMRNALEACEEQKEGEKTIDVRAEMKGSQMAVMIRNSYTNEVRIENGEFSSTKHEGKAIGLSSVKRVVEKYQGSMKVDYEQGQFCVCLFL